MTRLCPPGPVSAKCPHHTSDKPGLPDLLLARGVGNNVQLTPPYSRCGEVPLGFWAGGRPPARKTIVYRWWR